MELVQLQRALDEFHERGIRIVMALAEVGRDEAAAFLESANGNAAQAVALAKRRGDSA